MRINDILVEFAPSGDSGGSGDYFQALASAWYNGTFDSGSLQKGIKSQQDVEQLLQRGIIGPDGVTRKYGIDYNSTFDGVVISSDDYYEHADHDETDSRTGKPFGPYDYMEFGDEELDEGLTEVDRRGFLKGLGAAAVAGAAGGAKADRSWRKDELSQQFVGVMTSETFPGALLTWKDENKNFFLNLREPENFSAYNLEKNRLYFPKITSPTFQIKFGDDQPISGSGEIYTFPLRQFGNYTGFGMTLARGKTFDRWRDSFINADKVVMRLEIDGQPTTMTFHDNPGHIQQRQTQKKQPILDKIYQEEESNSKTSGFHGIYSAIQMRGMLEQYKNLSSMSKIYDNLDHEIKLLTSLTRGHKISQDIEDSIQLNNQVFKARPVNLNTVVDWSVDVYPQVMSRLKKYNAMLSGGANESVAQGMVEGLNEFAADSNDGGGEDDALRNYARMWWAGDEATQMQIERALAKMGWEIGEDEGGYDNGGVFVVRAGDINGNSYTSWSAEDLTEGMAEGVRTESAELAKQYGWAYNQGEYGASMMHPKHGRISLSSPMTSRSGDTAVEREWTHNNASGIGDRSLAQHLQSLKEQGMAEGDLNEKSTSQAQFRTMAAAAHDPEFAKKVGIKPSVAREFNRADKDQDYKDLPKKATEGAPVTTTPGSIEPGGAVDNFKQQMANNTERNMAEGNRKPEPPEADYGADYQDMVKRVKKLAGLGPLKTQYDPNKRVYKNMPTAVQPKK